MNVETWIILGLVAVLYLPFLLALLNIPLEILNGIGAKCHNTGLAKMLRLPYRIANWLSGGGVTRYSLFVISLFPSSRIRKFYYRLCGARIGKRVVFHFKTEMRSPAKLTVGDGTIIGDNAILDARSGLTMGKNVNLSSNVSIYTLQHNHRSPVFSCDFSGRKMNVNIGDRAWLGSNVVVLPGVTIGEGAVICAGSVVTKDVAEFDVVAGIPAKKVGERPRDLTYEFNGKGGWFI